MKNVETHPGRARNRSLFALVVLCAASAATAQTAGQKTFASAQQAVDAFVQAARSGDNSAMTAILGSGSEDVISSGDAVQDKASRDQFLQKYDAKHSLVPSANHTMTLDVGADNWPLPIPLASNSGKWYFDTAAGKEELLYRRIGHNEMGAIDVCHGVASAQQDYAKTGHDGKPAGTYAQKIVSDPGKQNGLYWKTNPGEPESPAGPMLADASSQGYDVSGAKTPYHGYYYRMLPNPGGFAFIAYPATYRVSGVMTFVITQDGVVHEKDLGPQTGEIVPKIGQYKIDDTWKVVE